MLFVLYWYVIIYMMNIVIYHCIVQILIQRVSLMFTAIQQVPTTFAWDIGGTWSSKLAGVRFVVDSHSTVGIDDSIPVKIIDTEVGTKSNGFLNKGWMAKANAPYGSLGPVSVSVINRADKNVAVFIGNSRLGFQSNINTIINNLIYI